MPQAAQFNGDLLVQGTVFALGLNAPLNGVTPATSVQQQIMPQFSQETTTTAAAEQRVVHVVYGATANIITFKVGLVVANIGGATITVDLLKNGASILAAAVVLDNTVTPYALVASTVTSPALIAGDVLTLTVTAAAGGGTIGKGTFIRLVVREDAQ